MPANLSEHLTPRALAYWFYDDGSAKRTTKGIIEAFTIATHSFSYEDCLLICYITKI